MREFTIRNKSSQPELRLSKAFLEKILSARPQVAALVLAKHASDYYSGAGQLLVLDPAQQLVIGQHIGAISRETVLSVGTPLPHPLSQVVQVFAEGFLARAPSKSLRADLELVESFYALLDASPNTTLRANRDAQLKAA